MNWISVKERLPQKHQWVLVYVKDNDEKSFHVGRYEGSSSWEVGHYPPDYYGSRSEYPSHWAELPEKPK